MKGAVRDGTAVGASRPLVKASDGPNYLPGFWLDDNKQRAKRSGVELPLIISDHADWNELTSTIDSTEADTIWVTHGREDALVHWCKLNGKNAEPLRLQGRDEELEI